jgi:cyclic pyranopterin phosphate synthase
MPEEDYIFTPASQLMQVDEIKALATIFVQEGVKKIRLTGGEPLVRKDAAGIIRALSELPVTLTLTTNATRLHEFINVLQEAKVRTVNISLDTLQQHKFQLVTRRDQFETVMSNIKLMITKGFHVKVNVVVMKGFNDQEINDFIEWTKDVPVDIRFIEFMPFAGNRWTSNKVFTLNEILEEVKQKYYFEKIADEKNNTSKGYKVPGHSGTFAVISTMSANFCGSCNRMRLTADGKLKSCLFSEDETDLLSALREGKEIVPLIHENISRKAKELGGQFSNDFEHINAAGIHNRSMITIGG